MKRGVLLLAAFLVLTSSVSAVETLQDGWVHNNDTFTNSAGKFLVLFPHDEHEPDKLVLQWETSQNIIRPFECKDWKGLYICWINHEETTPLDHQFERWQVRLRIERYKPEISIERTISITDAVVGDKIKVETVFKNTGDKDASNAVFVDHFPEGAFLFMDGMEKCRYDNFSAKWSGTLSVNGEITCKYTVVPRKAISFTSTARLMYSLGEGTSETSNSQGITVRNDSMDLLIEPENVSMKLDEQAVFNFTVVNDGDVTFEVTRLAVTVPEGLTIKDKRGELERTGQLVTWKGVLATDEEGNFSLWVEAARLGNFTIKGDATYLVRNYSRKASFDIPVEIRMDLPRIEVSISPANPKPGDEVTIQMVAKNPTKHVFSDIRADVVSDIQGYEAPNIVVGTIEPDGSYKLWESTLTVPDEPTPLRMVMYFENDRGQPLEMEKTITLAEYAKAKEPVVNETVEEMVVVEPEPIVEEEKRGAIKVIEDVLEGMDGNNFLLIAGGVLVLIFIVMPIIKKLKGGSGVAGITKDELKKAREEVAAFEREDNQFEDSREDEPPKEKKKKKSKKKK